VINVANARKVGIAARILGQQVGKNRTVNALWSAARQTGRSFGHIAHLLWLEVVGTLFLAMSMIGGVALSHEYAKYQAGRTTAGKLAIIICFTVAFAWYGVSSFWRVRQKARQKV